MNWRECQRKAFADANANIFPTIPPVLPSVYENVHSSYVISLTFRVKQRPSTLLVNYHFFSLSSQSLSQIKPTKLLYPPIQPSLNLAVTVPGILSVIFVLPLEILC